MTDSNSFEETEENENHGEGAESIVDNANKGVRRRVTGAGGLNRSDYMDADGRVVEGGDSPEDIALNKEAARIYFEGLERIKEKYNLTDEQVEAVLDEVEAEDAEESG